MNKELRVLLGPSTFAELDKLPLKKLRENGFEVIENKFRRKLSKDELFELLPGVTGLIAGLETLDRELLLKSNLKVISRCGAGMSNVDISAAKELGIKVFNTPDAPSQSVAELALCAILSLVRFVPQMNYDLHIAKWAKIIGRQLSEIKIGLIGFGRIGRKVAEMLKVFGPEILAVDPILSGESEKVRIVSKEEALKRADVISIHVSGEEVILGQNEFALMKEQVYIVNCSRGKNINERALVEALEKKQVLGAFIDCFEEEPYSGILTKYPLVVLTPHIGSYTLECRRNMEMQTVDNLLKGFGII